jgi:hypothetical protein
LIILDKNIQIKALYLAVQMAFFKSGEAGKKSKKVGLVDFSA